MNPDTESSSRQPWRDRAPACSRACGLAVVAAAAALALTGCGSSKSPSVASLTTTVGVVPTSTNTSSGNSGSGAPPSEAQLHQAALKYAQCMRTKGVPDFPDPNPGGGFSFHAGAGINPSSPKFQTARAECEKLIPGGGPPGPGTTTHPSPQWLAHMVTVAQCMRRHGINHFPDPTTSVPPNPFGNSDHGIISDIEGVILVFPSTIDTQSPLFTRAANACSFPLHNPWGANTRSAEARG